MIQGFPIEVRFKDIDIAGHVHNSVYLSYFEQARIAFFDKITKGNWNWRKKGLILARNEVDYHKPVYLRDKIQCSVRCDHMGTKSFTLSYKLTSEKNGETIVHTTGRSILVCMDYETEETVNIFEEWKDELTKSFES